MSMSGYIADEKTTTSNWEAELNRNLFCLVVCTSLCVGLSGCQASRPDSESTTWLEFDWPTADLLFQQDKFWVGGDGAYSIDLGNNRVLWLFGDSWIDQRGRGRRNGAIMISNSLAIQHGYDPSQATMDFFWGTTPDGKAQAFFPDFDGCRYWPGHGLRVDDHLLLFLMEVRSRDTGLGFEVTDWHAVIVTNPGEDPPEWEFEWLETPMNERQIIIGSGGILRHDRFIYGYGAQEPTARHDVYLVRWRQNDVLLGRLDRLEWWCGRSSGWLPDPDGEAAAIPVFSNGQTEFTVHYDGDSDRFIEFQTEGFGAAVLVQRTAPELTGPWSLPDTVFIPSQVQFPRIMIYQGKAHPHLGGADLVVTYCTNSFDFADHFSKPWLYYPRFVRMNDQ